MQCKDISDMQILVFLKNINTAAKLATCGDGYGMPTVQDCMPQGTPIKLQRAKMSQLIKRGLVDGCACGCRGDFRLTEKGYEKTNR